MSSIKHVAIIMDGNGRWAEGRSRQRVWGHVRGSSIVSDIVEEADDRGIEALTLYAFSTENWSRPLQEINTLFSLLKKFLLKEKKRIIDNNIRFKVMGKLDGLPEETKKIIKDLENETKDLNGLKLTFAFGYGGRSEIIDTVNRLREEVKDRDVTEEDFSKYLYQPELGDVDLLIRTGGDQRISNFLLWQVAYAELYFTETPWPDFSRKEFGEIIEKVTTRERRFGYVKECEGFKISSLWAKKNKDSSHSKVNQ
jgi:undecaprenyl diphosphate synthase